MSTGRASEPRPIGVDVRTFIERLSRERSLKRRLPSRFGRTPLWVSPDAQLRYLKPGDGAFDAELLAVVDEHIREDSLVWDIGANVGVFAFAAASVARSGSVLAVEADLWLAQLLRRSARLPENRGLDVRVLPSAVSDRNGVATLLIAKRGRASNALAAVRGRSQMGGVRERVTVPTLTLDTLLAACDAPTFVKIDVEGAEALLLRGGTRLLSEVRPTIFIEIGREAAEEVASILRDHRYDLFDGTAPLRGQAPLESCPFNTLAVPRERAGTTPA